MTLELTPYDSADFLVSVEAVEEYLAGAFESGDAGLISHSLASVLRSPAWQVLTADAAEANREFLASLASERGPDLATVLQIMKALGLSLSPHVARRQPSAAE